MATGAEVPSHCTNHVYEGPCETLHRGPALIANGCYDALERVNACTTWLSRHIPFTRAHRASIESLRTA